MKKMLLLEMKFFVRNYSCLQNPWRGAHRPQIPVLSVLNWICWTPPREQNSWVRHWMQQYADIYLLLNYSTWFEHPSRPSSVLHKTVVAASGTDYTIWGASFFKHDQIRTEEVCFPDMICTRDCNYSFMYSRWWARWTPETCRVI